MAFKARYEKQDDVPEAVRHLYVEKGGGWIPDLEQVGEFGLGDVGKLERALAREREAARTSAASEKAAREERDRLQQQIDGMGEWGDEKKRQAAVDAALAPHKRRFEEQEKTIRERASRIESALQRELRENRAVAAISKHAKDPRAVKALLPVVLSRTRVIEANDDFVTQVLDEDGKTPMLSRRDSSANMGIDELVGDVLSKDDTYALFFKGHTASGTNDPGSGGGGGKGGGDRGGQPRVIDAHDVEAKASALEDIAKGKAVVKGA